MNIKRNTAIVLIAAILGGMVSAAFAVQEKQNNNYSRDAELMIGLGLMSCDENGDFRGDSPISRADMAKLLVNTVEYAVNYDSIYGGTFSERYNPWIFYEGATDFVSGREIAPGTVDNDTYIPGETVIGQNTDGNMSGDNSQNASMYYDVAGNTDIEKVTYYEIMNGYDGKFYPDDNISAIDALTSVINLMGYRSVVKYMGGYPNGYLQLAKILDFNVTGLYEPITRSQLASLYVDVITSSATKLSYSNGNVVIDSVDGQSVMNKVMKLELLEGRMVKNEVTSLTGRSDTGSNGLQIGENVLYTSEKTKYAHDFIGRNVEAYYFNSDSDRENEIVYCRKGKKNKEIVFNLSNYIEYKNKTMKYYENDNEKAKKVSQNPFYIYNGLAVTNCPASYFSSKQGTVTLVDSASGEYDLIIIEAYESWYVDKAYETKDAFEIINKLKDGSTLTIDKHDIGTKVNIYHTDKSTADISDITKETVIDVSRNDDVIKIVISDEVVYDFKFSGSFVEDGNTIIKGNDREYTVSRNYLNSKEYGRLDAGKLYDVYLNSFGMAAYIYNPGNSSLRIGYLIKFIKDEEEETVYAKIVTASKTAQIFPLKEKIYFSDNTGNNENEKIKSYDKGDFLSGIPGTAIRYAVNTDGQITTIELPLDNGVKSKSADRLYVKAEASGDESDLTYFYDSGSMGSKVYMTADTPILVIPSDNNDISRYKILNYQALTKGNRRMTAYGINQDSPIADYVLYYDSAGNVAKGESGMWVITDIYKTVNENEEAVTAIDTYYYNKGLTNTYYLKEEDFPNGVLPFPLAIITTGEGVTEADYCSLGKGDIVTFSADTENNITAISLIFDADGKYDNTKYESRLLSAGDALDINFKWKEPGILAGTIGYWCKTISNTNPVMTDARGINVVSNNTSYAAHMGAVRYTLGYVYDITNDYVTYTTKNLKETDGELPDIKYGEKFIVDTKPITRVWSYADISGKTIEAGLLQENMDKLKTYKNYGKECSRILVCGGGGHGATSVYIINGSR